MPVTSEVTVQASLPHRGDISEQIVADATLSPLNHAVITPKITSPVKKLYVQRGAHVKAGQLLAVLENSDLSAAVMDNEGAYKSAEAAYANATHATVPEDYTRAELDLKQAKANLELSQSIATARTQLFSQGAIPGRDLDTAKAALVQAQAAYDLAQQHFEAVQKTSNKAALESAKGQLDSAKGKFLGTQAQLSYTEIRSPIDGIVTDMPVYPGETAAAGVPVITVMETSSLIAKLHIAQLMAQQLSVGAEATILVPGMDDPIAGKVTLISPALDPGSTTVEVWVRVENHKEILKAGTPVHVSITGRSANNALLIPTQSLQTAQDGGKFVMVIAADGTAHKHPATIGLQTATISQVLSGITDKDMVITTGSYALDEDTKVKVGAADDKPDAGKSGEDK
ncbi:efflux RND transporter periplasmic adaptor subunit [Acidicapsa ligni]|uniref:efflux RND transporter periplasmic adaptor subunit n=1 Tax=Acidicapsa ligni TaxID=542300 RepID=UPI0021E0A205|nr:efflux RND transporter periplasmic adaptor subunit [Acidicapsa ligni]